MNINNEIQKQTGVNHTISAAVENHRTSYPSICHDNQVKLLPMSLIASCEANESRAQFSVVSLEEIKLTETTKNGNNISRHVSFDSRDSSFSTNERFEILFQQKYIFNFLQKKQSS